MLPYDIFNYIIINSDIQTVWQLYQTDKTIKQLCNTPFCKVLVKFSSHEFFNLDAKSDLLDNFLNDITFNDKVLLRRLQLALGSCLVGDNILNKVIVFIGNGDNGKSTLLSILSRLLGHLFTKGDSQFLENDDYFDFDQTYMQDAHIVNFTDITKVNAGLLKSLVGKDSRFYKGCDYIPSFNIIIDTKILFYENSHQSLLNRLEIFEFPCTFGPWAPETPDEKINDPNMRHHIRNDNNAMCAFLNFLLQGCRDILNDPSLLNKINKDG